MAYDPNYSIKVGGHVQAFGPNGETLSTFSNVAGVASLAALKSASLTDGATYTVAADGSQWRYALTSVLAGDDFLVATPASGTGRLMRVDKDLDIAAAFGFATADGAVLYTVPAGFRLQLAAPFWSVSTTFTTANAGAAALKSSNAGLNTAGDILGGSTGDLVATLVSTGAYAKGTKGTKIGNPGTVLVGGDTVIYNLIAGAFTAGAGLAHITCRVILAPAA